MAAAAAAARANKHTDTIRHCLTRFAKQKKREERILAITWAGEENKKKIPGNWEGQEKEEGEGRLH